jgi:Leucine Rich Repeat.
MESSLRENPISLQKNQGHPETGDNATPGVNFKPDANFLTSWAEWASTAESVEYKQRLTAISIMRKQLENPEYTLDLAGLSLTTLPDLIPPCKSLVLSRNKLSALNITWPEGVTSIFLCMNRIKTFPMALPQGLKALSLRENPLCTLSAGFPASIRYIDVRHCKLEVLPESLFVQLNSTTTVDAQHNPLNANTVKFFSRIQSPPGYAGPRIYLTSPGQTTEKTPEKSTGSLQSLDARLKLVS